MIFYRITTHVITMTIAAGAKQQYSDGSAHSHDTVVKASCSLYTEPACPGLHPPRAYFSVEQLYALSNATVTPYHYMQLQQELTLDSKYRFWTLLTKEGHTLVYFMVGHLQHNMPPSLSSLPSLPPPTVSLSLLHSLIPLSPSSLSFMDFPFFFPFLPSFSPFSPFLSSLSEVFNISRFLIFSKPDMWCLF